MNIYINFGEGEGVMMFFENETLTPQQVEEWAKLHFPEVVEAYEVRDDELQYYIYESLWMTDAKVEKVRNELAKQEKEVI